MKLLLINPAFAYAGKDIFPLGLGYIAGVALQKKCEVVVIDENLGEDVPWSELGQFEVIGFTCTTPAFPRLVEIIARIQKIKDSRAILIAGGHHPTFCPEEVLAAGINICFRGEADTTFSAFLECLLTKKVWINLPGISYRAENRVVQHNPISPVSETIDDFPSPARQLFCYAKYEVMSLTTSRGCPYLCKYCAAAAFWGNKSRCRSVEKVIEELDSIMALHAYREIKFQDSIFTLQKKRTIELLQQMILKQYPFHWSCETRVDTLDNEILDLMVKARCKTIMLGIESGSSEILSQAGRQMDPQRIIDIARAIMAKGIGLRVSAIFGLPGETSETVEATIGLLRKIQPNVTFLNLATAYPGCALASTWKNFAEHSKKWVASFSGHGVGGRLILPDSMNPKQYRQLATHLQQEINSLNQVQW